MRLIATLSACMLFSFAALLPVAALAQDSATTPTAKPLPDIPTLMREVEANQRRAEAVEKDYIYHSVTTEQQLDAHAAVKKTQIIEADNFWLDGVPVTRVVKKDGRPLSPEDLAKEDRKNDEQAAKASERRSRAEASGKETDPRGEDEVTVSRLLELGAFTNPRRVQINGRDTIAVDFAGDSKAKTRNRLEGMIRDLAGTAWIDEQDHMLVRVEGRFVDTFKVGAGLVANIHKGTHFTARMTKINDEVWLPAAIDAEGAARVLLFWSFDGRLEVRYSDYRKFRATSTVLPMGTPEQDVAPGSPATQKLMH
jgi:hypothetical protein